MTDDSDEWTGDFTELVDRNGLVKLFANRTRARILVTLFYAEEPIDVGGIAERAGIYRSAVHEALDPLSAFGIIESTGEDGGRYRLAADDELVEAIRTVAERSTERFYDGEESDPEQ